MKTFDLDSAIRKIHDFPRAGILFYDITSILTNPEAFQYCIDQMVEIYKDKHIDAIACVEARGFVIAAPFAYKMGLPLILVRRNRRRCIRCHRIAIPRLSESVAQLRDPNADHLR